ncbi:unnamed protein product [Onchocerca flexuosa]|nr:unnamed protein product [Onchocerca flexuosa]
MNLNDSITEVGAKCGNSYHNNNEKMIKQQQQKQQQRQPYSDHGDEMLQQHNRTYDATEYHIQNAAQRDTEKPWRISVAY